MEITTKQEKYKLKVIGLDVCKQSVVGCLLDSADQKTEPRQLYYDLEFPKFDANVVGIKALLALKPDVAVLEPTGVNYMKIWAAKLTEAGIKVVLVGHSQLRAYRINLDLPDKDDSADALALASYYLAHHQSEKRFVRIRDPIIATIRDIVLRLHHLNRIQSPVINRIRQDLAWQFPEVASVSLSATLFWGWLAQAKKSLKYDHLLENSIGLGLQTETLNNARILWDIRQREIVLERQMSTLIKDVRFLPYRQVFAQFGFGLRIEALILSQIYPLENYLLNGKPEVKIRTGRNSGKPTKRHLSLRRFQKALGVAPSREDSGDSKHTKKAGSLLCRSALWQWLFVRIEPNKTRPKNPTGALLGRLMDSEKLHKPVKLARSRVCSKATTLLFKHLVAALSSPPLS